MQPRREDKMLKERTMTTQQIDSSPPKQIEEEKEKAEERRKNNMQTQYVAKDMKHYLLKFSQSLENILWPILMFFAPVKGILITVAAFIILDTISGLWKARVTKTPITSRGLSGIISKMLLYQAAILATYLLDFYVLGDILHGIFGIEGLLIKGAALLLVFIEAQSINENYKIAKGIDLWAELKKMLRRSKEVTTEVMGITKPIAEYREDKQSVNEEDLKDVFEDFED